MTVEQLTFEAETAFMLELGDEELKALGVGLDELLDLSPRARAQSTGEESTTAYQQLQFPLVRRNGSMTDSSVRSDSSLCSSATERSAYSSAADEGSGSEAGSSACRRPYSKVAWTCDEDRIILAGVAEFGNRWARIADLLPRGRSDDSVRNRWHRLQRKQRSADSSKRRGGKAGRAVDADADFPLPMDLSSLCAVPEPASPDAQGKHGDMWTPEEDRIIDEGVRLQGLRWKAIAALLPGRTDSGCRNRWVRIQERKLAENDSIVVHGAPDVMAALRMLGRMTTPVRGRVRAPRVVTTAATTPPAAHNTRAEAAAAELSAIGPLQPVLLL